MIRIDGDWRRFLEKGVRGVRAVSCVERVVLDDMLLGMESIVVSEPLWPYTSPSGKALSSQP